MVISTVNQVLYNGDGITTAWPYTFRIIDATDIKLTIIDADGTETDVSADYFVDTVNNTVYYPGYAPGAEPPEEDQPAPVQSGQKLLIYRQLPITQEKDLGDKWPFNVIELGLDKLTMILQQIAGWWDRCLKISAADEATHPDFDMTFPIEAGKSFRVNAEGTGFEVSDDPGIAAEAAYEALEKAEDAKDAAINAQEAAEAAAALVDVQAVWFDTVADMVADDIPAGNTAGTKGYYSVNDGGSGIYNIREKNVSDVDDGGSIIFLNNGNVAELIVGENVNVKQFGVKGDGVTDDTSAFTNALGFASGKNFFVPYGNYVINNNLFADGVKTVTDNGTYTNIKPVYPQTKPIIDSWDNCVIRHSYNKNALLGTNTAAQGMCYNSKTGKLIISEVKSDNSAQNLYVVNPSTFAVEATYSYTQLGHCNTLCFCPDTNKIYAVTRLDSGTDTQVATINADTMAYEGTFNMPDSMAQLKYDPVCKVFVSMQNNVDTRGIKIYDTNFTKLKEYTINYGISSTANGGIAYDGQVLMLAYSYAGVCDGLGNVIKLLQANASIEWEDGDSCDGGFFVVANMDTTINLYYFNTKREELLPPYAVYYPGVTIESNVVTAGYITSGGTALRFSISVSRQFSNITQATVAGSICIRQNGKYVGSPGNTDTKLDIEELFDVDTSVQLRGNGVINFFFESSTALVNAVNNDSCGIDFTYKITLS